MEGDTPFIDPFCGSGTIAIEACLIAQNIAPGFNRDFVSEEWNIMPPNIYDDMRDEVINKLITIKTFECLHQI